MTPSRLNGEGSQDVQGVSGGATHLSLINPVCPGGIVGGTCFWPTFSFFLVPGPLNDKAGRDALGISTAQHGSKAGREHMSEHPSWSRVTCGRNHFWHDFRSMSPVRPLALFCEHRTNIQRLSEPNTGSWGMAMPPAQWGSMSIKQHVTAHRQALGTHVWIAGPHARQTSTSTRVCAQDWGL